MRPCTVCQHARVREIDRQLSTGASAGAVARAFALGADAVVRHRANHISEETREAAKQAAAETVRRAEAREAVRQAESEEALERARPLAAASRNVTDADPVEENDKLRSFTYGLMARSFQTKDYSLTLRCAGEIRAQIEQSAKLKGRLADSTSSVVVIDSEALARKIEERFARLAPPSRVIDAESDE